jgi:CO/xanthine dehydrogenase Mo-binding subunit
MNGMINGRALLQATGTLVVTFSLTRGRAVPGPAGTAKTASRGRVDGFLALDIDGSVLVYSGKVDLGAHARTAFARIVADELDLPMDRVTVVQGDRALTPDQGPASESLFIRNRGNQLRRAAATARHALLEKAATQLDRHASMLAIRDGVVIAKNEHDGGRQLPLGTLVGGMSLALTLDDDAPRKTPADHIGGKPAPRLTRTAM